MKRKDSNQDSQNSEEGFHSGLSMQHRLCWLGISCSVISGDKGIETKLLKSMNFQNIKTLIHGDFVRISFPILPVSYSWILEPYGLSMDPIFVHLMALSESSRANSQSETKLNIPIEKAVGLFDWKLASFGLQLNIQTSVNFIIIQIGNFST